MLKSFQRALVAAVLTVSAPALAADMAPADVKGSKTIDADGILKLVEAKPNLVILDNRKEADYKAGHIEGAVRLIDEDITGPEVLAKHIKGKDTPALFYCNGPKCGRAAKAVAKAVEAGYTDVHYYYAGMDEWKAKGLPLVSQ